MVMLDVRRTLAVKQVGHVLIPEKYLKARKSMQERKFEQKFHEIEPRCPLRI